MCVRVCVGLVCSSMHSTFSHLSPIPQATHETAPSSTTRRAACCPKHNCGFSERARRQDLAKQGRCFFVGVAASPKPQGLRLANSLEYKSTHGLRLANSLECKSTYGLRLANSLKYKSTYGLRLANSLECKSTYGLRLANSLECKSTYGLTEQLSESGCVCMPRDTCSGSPKHASAHKRRCMHVEGMHTWESVGM